MPSWKDQLPKSLISSDLPDKTNTLVSAICIFATPGDGDGKNPDDSFVDAFVDVECYDNVYTGQGGFPNGSDIRHESYREMGVAFDPPGQEKIFYDGVKNVQIRIFGHKPNYQPSLNSDEWDVRWQLVLNFKKGQVLATPFFPNVDFDFGERQRLINPGRTHFSRDLLNNPRILYLGVKINRN